MGIHQRLILTTEDTESGAGDVNESNPLPVGGSISQAIPDFSSAADLLAAYGNFSGIAPGDFVTRVQTSNGQVITALSGGPIQPSESRIDLDVEVIAPCSLEIEASAIRNKHQFPTLGVYSNGADGIPDPVPDPINIVSISQSSAVDGAAYTGANGGTVTVVLETALPLPGMPGAVYLSDWIHIDGLVDNRLNYPNACINFISADRKTICFNYSDDVACPATFFTTVNPALGSAKVYFYNNAAGAHHGAGFRFTGATATQAAIWSLFGNGDVQISGTLLASHLVTLSGSATTQPSVLNGKMGQAEILAPYRFRIDLTPDEVAFYTKPRDSHAVGWTPQLIRSAVKPALQEKLKARFRLYQPLNMSRPVAEIESISKAGSTTWNVVTKLPHGLTTGNWTTIKGVRDQTNFAAFATPVQVTVTGANSFTLIGTTGTATSHGGSVILTNGGVDQPGIIGQAITAMSNYAPNPDWLVLTGSATWSGLAVGDYTNVHGNQDDVTGANIGAAGAWEVANLATSQLIIKPVYDIFGNRVSPVTPVLSGTVNCGGSVILRTTLRAHDLMLKQFAGELMAKFDGQGTGRVDKAMPTLLVAPVSANTTETAALAATPSAIVTAATTNASIIKSTAGTLFAIAVSNLTAATIFVKLYNKASAPTVGTDVPVMTIPVAAGVHLPIEFGRLGLRFSLGIGIAVTGAAPATDATVVAAGAQLFASFV